MGERLLGRGERQHQGDRNDDDCRHPEGSDQAGPAGEQVLADDAGHRHHESGGGGQERCEGSRTQARRQQVRTGTGEQPFWQRQHDRVGVTAADQVEGVHPAESGVADGQEVEGAEEEEHSERRTSRGAAVGVGVEADDDVRQPHRAQERGEHEGVGQVGAVRALHRLDPLGDVEVARGPAVVVLPAHEEEHERYQEQDELQPVLEGLHERDAAHPAGQDVQQHDDRDDAAAQPPRGAGEGPEGQPRALELRHQVEHTDQHDQAAGHAPGGPGLQAQLGEVRHRVGAGTTQGCGDEQEQHEIPRGPADRVPEHVRAPEEHEPGDPEERRG